MIHSFTCAANMFNYYPFAGMIITQLFKFSTKYKKTLFSTRCKRTGASFYKFFLEIVPDFLRHARQGLSGNWFNEKLCTWISSGNQ